MSRLAWEVTFGGLCWIAAGIAAAACFYAFTREEQQRREREEAQAAALAECEDRAEVLTRVLEALDYSLAAADVALWEAELAPQRPVYDVEEDGL